MINKEQACIECVLQELEYNLKYENPLGLFMCPIHSTIFKIEVRIEDGVEAFDVVFI